MRTRPFAAWALWTTLALGPPCGAQEGEVRMEIRGLRLVDSGQEKTIAGRVATDLPEGASVSFLLSFEGETIVGLCHAVYLDENGEADLDPGPLERELLPGRYEVRLRFDPNNQDPAVADLTARFGSVPFDRATWLTIGTEEEEARSRALFRDRILEVVEKVEAAAREVEDARLGLERRTGRFFEAANPSRFRREEFVAWAEGVVAVLDLLLAFATSVPEECYVPYDLPVYRDELPQVHQRLSSALYDQTIHRVLVRERDRFDGVEVPEGFDEPRGREEASSFAETLELARVCLKRVRKRIGAGPEPVPLLAYVPSGETQVPPGFELGEVPPEIRYLLPENPVHHEAWTRDQREALSRFLGVFEVPGSDVSALLYALVGTPGGEAPGDRVVVVVLRFADELGPRFGLAELEREDRPAGLPAPAALAEGETLLLLVPSGGDAAREAADRLRTWYGQAFGFVAAR